MGIAGITYYVRTNGNDGNPGTGHTAGQAWQTINKAISELANNVTVYVAPGDYDQSGGPAFMDISNNKVSFIGDLDAARFPDIGPGEIIVDRTGYSSLFRIDGSGVLVEGMYAYDTTGAGPAELFMVGSVGSPIGTVIRRINMSTAVTYRPPTLARIYSGSTTVIIERCNANRAGTSWDGMSVLVDSGASNILVQNCFMITGTTGGAVRAFSGSDDVTVQNCTLILAGSVVDILVRAVGTNVTVRNTVMVIDTNNSNAFCMDVDAAAVATFTSDYNLIRQLDPAGVVGRWGATAYSTLADWQAGTGQDVHSIDPDPVFVNVGGGDYHIQFTSPCIDVGTSTGAPNDDLDGNARPQ